MFLFNIYQVDPQYQHSLQTSIIKRFQPNKQLEISNLLSLRLIFDSEVAHNRGFDTGAH